jgi:hypothetical protein
MVEVLGGVLVLGGIAATGLPTDQAHAKVDPRISCLLTFFANMLVGFFYFDLVEVGAFFCHRLLLFFLVMTLQIPTSISTSRLRENTRFVSGYRFSDTVSLLKPLPL